MKKTKILYAITTLLLIVGCAIAAWQPHYSFKIYCNEHDTSVKTYYDSLKEVKLDFEHSTSFISIPGGAQSKINVPVFSSKNIDTIRIDFNKVNEIVLSDFSYELSPLWVIELDGNDMKNTFTMWTMMAEPIVEENSLKLSQCEADSYIYAEHILDSGIGAAKFNFAYFLRLVINLLSCILIYLILKYITTLSKKELQQQSLRLYFPVALQSFLTGLFWYSLIRYLHLQT